MNASTNKAEEKVPIVSALVSVGVLMIPAGFLRWYFYHDFVDFGWRDWVFVLSAPVYFALGAGARFGAQRVGQWMWGIGLIFQVLALPTYFVRNLNPWRDGSLFLWPIVGLLVWAAWAASKRWEASIGLPPIDSKTAMKISACSVGFTVSLFTLGGVFLQLSLYSELFASAREGDLIYDLARQARICAIVSAAAASIMTLSLTICWKLMRERGRQRNAAKQAAAKSNQA
ncbi:MAG: hypothetical protein ABMA26_03180 [Limisphaerales bacterium]